MRFTRYAPCLALAAGLVLVLAMPTRAAPGEETLLDASYALHLDGVKVGWTRQRITREETADGTVRWRNDASSQMLLTQADTPIVVAIETVTVEDETGKVLDFGQRVERGMGPMYTTGRIVDGKLELTSGEETLTIDYPEGAVGPVRWKALLQERGVREGTVLEGKIFDTDLPTRSTDAKMVVGKREEVDLYGRKKLLWRVTSTSGKHPEAETLWVDDSATVWVSERDVPLRGFVRTVRAEEMLAMSELQPDAILNEAQVVPYGTIDAPRALARGVYRLGGRGLKSAFEDGPGQRVLERSRNTAVVEVVVPPVPETPFEPPYRFDASWGPYLTANAFLETADEAIRSLAQNRPAAAANAVEAARAIEQVVRETLAEQAPAVGFGTAAEALRAGTGDCSERGVLAAALARAIGLPSRVVVGLVYLDTRESETIEADGAFAYHLWTEVLVAPDTWMAIDATLGMDATHLAMARSDLSRGNPLADLLFPVLGVLRKLKIEIVQPEPPQPPGDGG